VHGYVRNEADGSVLLDVEGTALDVNRLLTRIQAEMQDNIEGIQVDEGPLTGVAEGFIIRH
jgi:acylphosphatase